MTYMAQEIAESGAAAQRCLRENAEAFAALGRKLRARDPAVVVTNARGSSDHCALYLKYRGQQKVGGDKSWEAYILGDFAELQKAGLTHPLIQEIEKMFAGS